ncbi:MAG: class I SAM-dependent methyltransferase, partial [Phycisphaerae bacterium]|nr:class I SAM-dependent methyltransferase [Phycisphaerae bacterium]
DDRLLVECDDRLEAPLPAVPGDVVFKINNAGDPLLQAIEWVWPLWIPDEPVDRIVSIGAFEHFRKERYAKSFRRCRQLLPSDGRMLLHTIVLTDWMELQRAGVAVTHEDVLFARFILDRNLLGGQLCAPPVIVQHAQAAGFQVLRQHSLRLHYARTLDLWSANLLAAEERAIELTSPEIFETYRKYVTGCSGYFRRGHIDVVQFACACEA